MFTMTKEEILNLVGKNAREAQIRDDVCSRSLLIGLKAYFDFIPEDMIRASMSLCGGAGASSGSCGTYTCGLLAIGLKYNVPLEDEMKNPELQEKNAAKFMKYRDRFIKEMGTTLCPELQKDIRTELHIYKARGLRGILEDYGPQCKMCSGCGEGCKAYCRDAA